MNLEDHIGDVLRKARESAGITPATAARIAGISEQDWVAFEKSGQTTVPLNFWDLAKLVGLDGKKLESIAGGWRPKEPDLTLWRELRIITTTRLDVTVKCYLIWDEVTRDGALFDTGWDAEPLFKTINENGVNLRHLFLTHMHEDHVAALEKLRERFPKLLLHTNAKSAPPQHRNRANDFIHLNSLRITNRDAPGHAEEGVIYVVGNWPEDAPHVAFVGDTIFAGSLAVGIQSTELLKQKVREQIFSLPGETLLCPGHGPPTTVAEEKVYNPFF